MSFIPYIPYNYIYHLPLLGCELEHPGPVPSDRFVRSMAFRPNAHSYIDIRHHPLIVPPTVLDSFSVELFFMLQVG
jgi:hypothetical protein